MADSININHVSWETIKSQNPRWESFLLMEQMIDKGRKPEIIHFDITLDTSKAAPAAETTKPTNEVLNFAVPQQVFIRSDAAGDIDKKVDVIGQKADGSFGQFTLTSDGTDGTTPVDVGTWNFIMQPKKNDAWAGNCIIDSNGVGGVVFWTLALGATPTDGILIVPDGYWGDVLAGYVALQADTGAAGEGMVLNFGNLHTTLTRNLAKDVLTIGDKGVVAPGQARLALLNNWLTAAVTLTYIHVMFVVWEK